LAEDARFCHRCGRPTVEIAAEEPTPQQPVSNPQLTAAQKLAQLPVSFANPIALRVAFLLAMAIMLVQNIPVLQLLFVIWWLGAGWAAVLWYRRLTGSALSVQAGARLGSITGVMIFAAIAVESALQMLVAGRQVFEQLAAQDARVTQLLNDPVMLGVVFLVTIGFIFTAVVGLCAAGGALGARFTSRRSNP